MVICNKCHSFFKKKAFARHKRTCVPSKDAPSMVHYNRSKGSSITTRKIQEKK